MDKELEQSRKNFEEIYTKSDPNTQSLLSNYLKSIQNYIDSENINNFSINKLNKSAYDTAIELLDFIRNEVTENNIYPERQFLCKYCTYADKCEKDGGF